jgi:hypothetical protein
MSEFSKILITALSSFTVGIVSEPIRAEIAVFLQKKRLRRALYIELATLHSFLSRRMPKQPTPAFDRLRMRLDALRLRNHNFETYRYARTKPEVFYSLSDAVAFDDLYRQFDFLVRTIPSLEDDEGTLNSGDLMLDMLDYALKEGRFNDDLLKEVSPEYVHYLAAKEKKKQVKV